MFYDRFACLCAEKGVTVSRGAQEAGISKSLVTKWKTNGVEVPSAEVRSKLSRYFGLSMSELRGERREQPEPTVSTEELKVALFRGREEVTDAMLEEVLSFAEYVARREDSRKKTP